MYAQHHSQNLASTKATVARLLLEANTCYGESNNPGNRHGQRVLARNECRSLLDEALALNPDEPVALGLLGRVEMDEGNLQHAHHLFNVSLTLKSDQPQQYSNLGYWALASERPALAEQYFQEALGLDRQSAAAFCGIAHAKRQQSQFDVAYLHYRKLLELGLEWPSIYSGMLVCAENLKVEKADSELARDAIALLSRDDLPHQEIGRFVGSILVQKYDLGNADAQIQLDDACDDELLILALQKTLMPDPTIEDFVNELRRSILAEVATTATLQESRQSLTMAIARYVDRTGYALPAADDEENLVEAINESIQAQFLMGEPMDAVTGSLILSAMYGALFHQLFAVQLGQWNLVDWPLGMQSVVAASYYDRATEEAIKQNFDEKMDELCLDKADVPQAWPSWAQLAYRSASSLKTLMAVELKLSTDNLPETLRLMLCGAQSGQRALELASYLDDVEVIAVDESLGNIAKATRRAEELGLSNIVFWPWSIAQRFVADGHQVQWVEIGRLPSVHMTDVSLPALVSSATSNGSVVHMHTNIAEQSAADQQVRKLIAEHNLQPTRATLRRLRRMVLNNKQDDLWQELLSESDFYGLGGCQDRWFRPQDSAQLEQLMAMVSNEVEWKLVKARDADGHSLATGPVQKQLQAEALGSAVQSLMGQALSVYFVKRR
ncbi:class I SAM-dependent methyltransferase [Marinobacter salicampi]|uniref:class I SAM-dependent methyltransferase n=1 Tax=Marinobacter salicampi TaxID=435907 RepID=UPI00140A6CDE|nr:class I SAM-dependent methyltransferase [Marinobacter salicampi]